MFEIVFICVALLGVMRSDAAATALKEAIRAHATSCNQDHPISLRDIDKTVKNKMLPDDEHTKCFVECFFKKIGIMDDTGNVSTEGARRAATVFKVSDDDAQKFGQYIETCSTVNKQVISEEGAKGCERAKLLFTCLVDNGPKFGFDVIRNFEGNNALNVTTA